MEKEGIRISIHENRLKDYFNLYFVLVKVPAIVMMIFIPLAIALATFGTITGKITALLCILLYVLGGICSAYLIMFNIIFPIRAHKSSKQLDLEESAIFLFEDKIKFHSVFDLVKDGKKKHYEDDNQYPIVAFKKIKDKKDKFLFVTKKEYGNYAFFIWKEKLDEKSLELIKSYFPNK